jgi:hypothetical protein
VEIGSTTLRDLIARNVMRLRLDADATHSDIVKAARHHGLEWSESWISGLERAQKTLTAEQFLILPFVLATALRHHVAVADLLVGDEPVALAGPDGTISASRLYDTVTASAAQRNFTARSVPVSPVAPEIGEAARRAQRLRDISRAGLGDVDIRKLAEAESDAGDAEERMARKLGVPLVVVIAAAAMAWGRSITAERTARVSALDPTAGADEQAKLAAAVTRKMNRELADCLAEASARRMQTAVEADTGEVEMVTPAAEVIPEPV